MGMNIQPGQRAWISVPRTAQTMALGIDQIHGHVVQTVAVHPGSPVGDPQWIVEPPQSVRVPRDVHGTNGSVRGGTVLNFEGVPESYLRPFDDFPPEELDELQAPTRRELVS